MDGSADAGHDGTASFASSINRQATTDREGRGGPRRRIGLLTRRKHRYDISRQSKHIEDVGNAHLGETGYESYRLHADRASFPMRHEQYTSWQCSTLPGK
jgi:hypothetical protein